MTPDQQQYLQPFRDNLLAARQRLAMHDRAPEMSRANRDQLDASVQIAQQQLQTAMNSINNGLI